MTMTKNFKLKAIGITAAIAMCASMMTGCNKPAQTTSGSNSQLDNDNAVGSLLLSVNPEIEIEYDKNGNVLELDGLNDDGLNILNSYKDFVGRPCKEVVRELVAKIDEAGYFENTVSGNEKNIIIKLDPESDIIDDNFLNSIADEVRTVVGERHIGSNAVAVDKDDYDDNYKDKGYINAQTAEEILKTQLNRSDIKFIEKDYDIDDGKYEIEFILDGKEYEYEVDAATGKVLEVDVDNNDNNDDRDDVYDDHDDNDDDRDDVYDDHDDNDDDRNDVYDDHDDNDDDDDDRDDIHDDDNDDDNDDDHDDDR